MQIERLSEEEFDSVAAITSDDYFDNIPGLRISMWAYYSAIEVSAFENLSVKAVDDDGTVLAAALANNCQDCVGYFGQPIMVQFTDSCTENDAVEEAILTELEEIGTAQKLNQLRFANAGTGRSYVSKSNLNLLNKGAIFKPTFSGAIDLSKTEAEIRTDIRKSYKSLINYGNREISLNVIDKNNPDFVAFERFENFHEKISGKKTRSKESWTTMFRLISQGNAELIVGSHAGEEVSYTYLFFDKIATSYGSGVYDRSKFDKPISHWPLYHSIIRAKERGNKFFDIGKVYEPPEADEKEHSIAYFKKGFTSQVFSWQHWKLNWPDNSQWVGTT